jgi:hypothetical protein
VDRLHTRLIPFVVAVAFLASGCSRPTLGEPTFESDEALARAVLDGIARKDGDGLLRLSVTEDEFEELVWPTLPVSRPEVGMPIAYVWQDTRSKSRNHLIQTLAKFGGQRYQLARLQFDGPTTDHGTYTVSRETSLFVRDDRGRERKLQLFGSIIRQQGRSKVFSYIVD